MLRIIQNSASEGAKSYYSTSDYYSEGQELVGLWRGKGAERLGLSGVVDRLQWDRLCDNLDPQTGRKLTIRQRQDRRVGYDFNFHVPKSMSLLYGLTHDDRLLDAFRESVRDTMHDMEAEMQTRVRRRGKNEDRATGNMVWGEFTHFTARPVDGVPDPHLHAHGFVFNTTYDESERRWKAGQFAGLKRDAPYFEAVFHSRLAHRLAELGLPIERTRHGWELAGLSKSTLDKFSRRTKQIEDKARELGITDPDAKGELGTKTRAGKAKQLSLDELRDLWASWLSNEESATLTSLERAIGTSARDGPERAVPVAVSRAVSHCFERSSVVPERTLLAEALKGAYGVAAPETVLEEAAARPFLRAERGGRQCVTTPEVLAEEQRMLDFGRSGRGTCVPLVDGTHAFHRDWLNEGQRAAVRHVLSSKDRVVLVRGKAGTGKTTMMQEAVEAIERAGHRVFTFAPSADASRGVLRSEGFASADTVQRVLLDPKLQEDVRGAVLWIDEAGLLSTRTTLALFDLADRLDARLVLSGDRRQHGSVERGATLRLLEEEAGLVPAEIKEIQRQKCDYKRAVEALSEVRISDGFHKLDRLGWIREVASDQRYRLLADDYVLTIASGKTALVVSPTHREGAQVTDAIRVQLKERGRLHGEERTFDVLESANLTEAERSDAVNYSSGDILIYHQNSKEHRKGDRVEAGQDPLPLEEAARFQLFRPSHLELAAGDSIRITRNGATADGKHRLNNGAMYDVHHFDRDGNIVLDNGWTIGKGFGHLAYGYCVTSHASQGKTVDRVLIGQSADSLPASNQQQFYVSVSRGRKQAVIYTDDKHALLDAVERHDDRVSATELMRDRAATVRRSLEASRDSSKMREAERDQRDLVHG